MILLEPLGGMSLALYEAPEAAEPTGDSQAPVVSASSPMPQVLAAGTDGDPPIFANMSLVQIHGIEKKPELNEKIGLVLSYDGGADRRYTVKVSGSSLRLREDKLAVAPEGSELAPEDTIEALTPVVPALSAEEIEARAKEQEKRQEEARIKHEKNQEEARIRDEKNIEFIKNLPQGELTSTGHLVATYAWVQVPSVAILPQGMEIWMLAGLKCARIPASWRVQIAAERQLDTYRVDVGENTPVLDVVRGAAAKFGWAEHDIELRVDGKVFKFQEGATIGSAGLFGRKLTAQKLF